jgi:hypothetical protein
MTRAGIRKLALRLLIAAIVLIVVPLALTAVFELGVHDSVGGYAFLVAYAAFLIGLLIGCGAVLCFIASFLFPRARG